jgi:hypothetical protein
MQYNFFCLNEYDFSVLGSVQLLKIFAKVQLFFVTVPIDKWTLEYTEGPFKNGRSGETGNIDEEK